VKANFQNVITEKSDCSIDLMVMKNKHKLQNGHKTNKPLAVKTDFILFKTHNQIITKLKSEPTINHIDEK